jgi:Emfourin
VNVSIVRGGGLAGVATRTVLATDSLPADAATELRERAGVVGAVEDVARERGPDETLYSVEIEDDDGRGRVARYSEWTLPEDVRRLIAFVDERPESRMEFVRPKS